MVREGEGVAQEGSVGGGGVGEGVERGFAAWGRGLGGGAQGGSCKGLREGSRTSICRRIRTRPCTRVCTRVCRGLGDWGGGRGWSSGQERGWMVAHEVFSTRVCTRIHTRVCMRVLSGAVGDLGVGEGQGGGGSCIWRFCRRSHTRVCTGICRRIRRRLGSVGGGGGVWGRFGDGGGWVVTDNGCHMRVHSCILTRPHPWVRAGEGVGGLWVWGGGMGAEDGARGFARGIVGDSFSTLKDTQDKA